MGTTKVAGGKSIYVHYKYREEGADVWHPRAIREGTEDRVLNTLAEEGNEYAKITKEEYDNLLQQKRS